MAGEAESGSDGLTLAAALAAACAWVIDAVVGSTPGPTEQDVAQRFAPRFLEQVPPATLVTVLAGIRSQVIASGSTATAPVTSAVGATFTISDRFDVSLTIESAAPHRILGLLFSPSSEARRVLADRSHQMATWVTNILTGAESLPTAEDVKPLLNDAMLNHAPALVAAFSEGHGLVARGSIARLETDGEKTSFVIGDGPTALVGWASVDRDPPHLMSGVQFVPLPDGAGPVLSPAQARRHRQSTLPASADATLDDLVTQLATETHAPGVVLVVARDGEMVHVDGRGEAWLGAETPPDENTFFRVGSISKIVTALAVLRQVRAGKMSLDEPITSYVTGVEIRPIEGASAPSVRHLLTQTSGLQRDLAAARTATEDFGALVRDGLDAIAAPGTVEAYSNVGFGLLGLALEAVTDRSYAELVADELPGATADANPPASPPAATGYEVGVGIARPAGLQRVPELAAGAVVATPAQLLLLGRRMYEDPDLGQRQDLPTRHALAALRTKVAGRDALFHNGGLSGWKASLYALPADRIVVAVTVNVRAISVDRLMPRVVQAVVSAWH